MCFAGCTPIAGYTAEADLDGGAGSLRLAASFATAAAECSADATCMGFNNYAYLVPAMEPKRRSWGTCLYTRISTTSECGGEGGWVEGGAGGHTRVQRVWCPCHRLRV